MVVSKSSLLPSAANQENIYRTYNNNYVIETFESKNLLTYFKLSTQIILHTLFQYIKIYQYSFLGLALYYSVYRIIAEGRGIGIAIQSISILLSKTLGLALASKTRCPTRTILRGTETRRRRSERRPRSVERRRRSARRPRPASRPRNRKLRALTCTTPLHLPGSARICARRLLKPRQPRRRRRCRGVSKAALEAPLLARLRRVAVVRLIRRRPREESKRRPTRLPHVLPPQSHRTAAATRVAHRAHQAARRLPRPSPPLRDRMRLRRRSRPPIVAPRRPGAPVASRSRSPRSSSRCC